METIAKRAGNHCSNPDCFAVTSGPANDDARSINVGEAAHIYGARPGAARYNAAMSDAERSDITNSIWLCRNCHKIADADAVRFPAEVLFEWRRAHEQTILEKLGKAGALIQQKVLQRKLAGFENCSYLAQQIIIDKPPYWEYKLTAELLRSLLEPIKRRWEALEKGLYALPRTVVRLENYFDWSKAQMDNFSGQIDALGKLATKELAASWGPPGQPGSEEEIFRVCSLIAEACERILAWEEVMRFTSVPEEVSELRELLIGTAGRNMERIFEIPRWMTTVFSEEKPGGRHEMTVVFDFPPNWVEEFHRASDRVTRRLQSRR